jgi:hypothetical protein
VVNEHSFTAGGAKLGLLRLGVLLQLRNTGIFDFMCHAENGTAEVSSRLGFGRGFWRIVSRRVAHLGVDAGHPAENGGGLNRSTALSMARSARPLKCMASRSAVAEMP